jgi:hypothetical protein
LSGVITKTRGFPMTLRRCLLVFLAFLMFNPVWVAPLFAQPHGGWKKYSPGQLRMALGVLGTGQDAHVSVKLRDKTTFSGYVSQVDPTRFLLMDTQTAQVIPVSYRDVKELRAENAADGVEFAARVSLNLNLDADEQTSTLWPGEQRCDNKGEWIAYVVGMGFLAFVFILLAVSKD